MKAAQILGLGSLLALAVALIVVLAGQQVEVKDLLEPGSQGSVSRSRAASDSVIGQGDEASVDSDLSTLIEEAIYARVGRSDAGPAKQLEASIAKSEPEIPLGTPLSSGGYSMRVFGGGGSVLFCAKPDYYYVCQSINLSTRQKAEGKNHRLKLATYSAEVVGQGAAPKAEGSGGGVVQGAIQKAEQLEKEGVR